MKSADFPAHPPAAQSLPVRGAWIEIAMASLRFEPPPSGRSPCGERGLKCAMFEKAKREGSRSPCGERGLKFCAVMAAVPSAHVAPRAGSVD